jgi:hypothetical protein
LTSDDRFHRYFISLVHKNLPYWSPKEAPLSS